MHRLRASSFGWILFLLVPGAVWAQEYPQSTTWDGVTIVPPTVSGVFNVLEIATQDVEWDGSGSVTIPFTINQRGTVWMAVYRKGSNEVGRRGPGGGWLRLEPQDLFVARTPGISVEAGRNSITWDGIDFEGNPAGSGAYEFDLIGVNNVDNSSLAGPASPGGGWTENSIDVRLDPPEVWVHEHHNPQPDIGRSGADMIRGTLGTDYIANPSAWERWNYREVFDFEGAHTWGGTKVDDVDPEIWWTNHRRGEMAGLFKMQKQAATKTFSRVTDFGENGWSKAVEDNRIVGIAPWGEAVYQVNWSVADNPTTGIHRYDKATGEFLSSWDTNEFYTFVAVDDQGNEQIRTLGPGKIHVNERGMWISAWRTTSPVLHMNHEGTPIWAHFPGDGVAGSVSFEQAEEFGVAAHIGIVIHTRADRSGKVVFLSETERPDEAVFAMLGRDGSGIAPVSMAPGTGPWQPGPYVWYLNIVSAGSSWDGLYKGTGMNILTHDYEHPEEGNANPGMMMYIPYGVGSGRLGDGATAVQEIQASGLPSSYSLRAAYPNPFNPDTTIEFALPADDFVKIHVFNTAGQFITRLVHESLSAGAYKTTWNGRDQLGKPVASGVYFYRMQAGAFTATHSATLLK